MGLTDGTFVCGLCGDWRTGCSLCGEAPLRDRREDIRREASDAFNAETEMRAQERAIRAGSYASRPTPPATGETP
jgi:hypothetical protein